MHLNRERNVQLNRLIVVLTGCTEWQVEERDWRDIQQTLLELLRPDLPGRAWVPGPAEDHPAGLDVEEMVDGLAQEYRRLTAPGGTGSDFTELCRICLDPERLRHVLQTDDGLPDRLHVAMLDVHFASYLGRLYCHLTLTLRTQRPVPDRHRPGIEPRVLDAPLSVAEAERFVRRSIGATQRSFRRWLARRGFHSIRFRAARPSHPPAFVFAGADGNSDANGVAAVLGPALFGIRSGHHGSASSDSRGDIRVWRQLVPVDESDRPDDHPRYLLIPRRPDRGGPPDQEEAAAALIRACTWLEAVAAANLDAADTVCGEMRGQLEMSDAYLGVCEEVRARAADLWDSLALHLSGRGKLLQWAHRSVELLHHTLLQGVADLAQIRTDVDQQLEKLEATTNVLRERMEHAAAGHAAGGRQIRASIAASSSLDRMRDDGRRVSSKAVTIYKTYEILLDAMARAFDERRTRESDVVEKAALPLGISVGLFGVVAVVQTTVDVTWNGLAQTIQWAIRAACWGLGAAAVAYLMRIAASVHKVAQLGSSDFEKRYQRLTLYLRRSSTMSLAEFSGDGSAAAAFPDEATWQDKDARLSTELAARWDEIFTPRPRVDGIDGVAEDLEQFRARTEDWCLRALLLAERPRSFAPYLLPQLAVLYRMCSKLARDYVSNSVTLVAPPELRTVLERACGADSAWVNALDKWIDEAPFTSAAEALTALQRTGIRAGASRGQLALPDLRPAAGLQRGAGSGFHSCVVVGEGSSRLAVRQQQQRDEGDAAAADDVAADPGARPGVLEDRGGDQRRRATGDD
jgi:hypothetical protein